jgi:hypothetical protein
LRSRFPYLLGWSIAACPVAMFALAILFPYHQTTSDVGDVATDVEGAFLVAYLALSVTAASCAEEIWGEKWWLAQAVLLASLPIVLAIHVFASMALTGTYL